MSRNKRRRNFEAEVSSESLNDIMFFLMLFFLIVSTLANPNAIKLLLPNAKFSSRVEKQPIILSIDKEKNTFINNTPVSIDYLERELSKSIIKLDNPTIVLRVDQSLSIQDLVNILQIGNKLKIKMVMATNTKN